jgi:hypothetical protein
MSSRQECKSQSTYIYITAHCTQMLQQVTIILLAITYEQIWTHILNILVTETVIFNVITKNNPRWNDSLL